MATKTQHLGGEPDPLDILRFSSIIGERIDALGGDYRASFEDLSELGIRTDELDPVVVEQLLYALGVVANSGVYQGHHKARQQMRIQIAEATKVGGV